MISTSDFFAPSAFASTESCVAVIFNEDPDLRPSPGSPTERLTPILFRSNSHIFSSNFCLAI